MALALKYALSWCCQLVEKEYRFNSFWIYGGLARCDQLKNAMYFVIYVVYFSSRKTSPLSDSWKHPHKYLRKVKAFIFNDFLVCYRCYKNKYSIQIWYRLRCSYSSLAILRDETVLALGSKTWAARQVIKWRACDVGEAKEGLENEQWCRWSNGRVVEWAVM